MYEICMDRRVKPTRKTAKFHTKAPAAPGGGDFLGQPIDLMEQTVGGSWEQSIVISRQPHRDVDHGQTAGRGIATLSRFPIRQAQVVRDQGNSAGS
jgi:hypothetical protein